MNPPHYATEDMESPCAQGRPLGSSRLVKKGCAEGHSPFAGSLRVSLRYKFFPLSAQEGSQGIVEGVFQQPAMGSALRKTNLEGGV